VVKSVAAANHQATSIHHRVALCSTGTWHILEVLAVGSGADNAGFSGAYAMALALASKLEMAATSVQTMQVFMLKHDASKWQSSMNVQRVG
jgi:hypothetical protein